MRSLILKFETRHLVSCIIHAATDGAFVAERHRKLARHEVSGKRAKRIRPERTVALAEHDSTENASAVPLGRNFFGRFTRHNVPG